MPTYCCMKCTISLQPLLLSSILLVPSSPFRHFLFSSGERKKYYKHQKKAEKRPDKYLSLIIDGMDQSKTHLPHWIQKSKVRLIINWTKFRLKTECYFSMSQISKKNIARHIYLITMKWQPAKLFSHACNNFIFVGCSWKESAMVS